MVPSPNHPYAERTSGIPYNAGYGGYAGYGEYVVMQQGTGEEQRLGFQAGAAGFPQRYQQQQGIAAMAGRPPSSAGGGAGNPQLYNPQQFATSTGAVTPMMMVQQQQQQQQQQRPGQQQLQQRATPVGQQQQQQIRAGPYQQQQYVHHMASAPSVNQVRPGPQGTTGAGTPHYSNMSMTQQQNMQESPPESLCDSASTAESVRNPGNVVPSVAPVTNPVKLWYPVPEHFPPLVDDWYGVLESVAPVINSVSDWYGVPPSVAPVMNSVYDPFGVPPSVASLFDPSNDLSSVVDELDVWRIESLLGAERNDESLPSWKETGLHKIPSERSKRGPVGLSRSKHELSPEPDTKQETVRQKANLVQTPYMGALPQQNLGASRQGVPLTTQQQQQQQVQQQQALHTQQQVTQQRLGTPQQQAMARQTHGQQILQNPGNTMLARASSTGAQMQGVATQQPMYAMAKTPQYQQAQQPQQQARPQMVPTSLATNNQARPGTPGAAAQPQNSLPSSAPAATAAPTEPLDATRSILSKRSIQDLLAQIDPRETLDPDVEDVMLEIADDFIESVASFSVKLAKHRKSDVLDAKDVMLHLEKHWNINVPGFGGDEYRSYKRPSVSETHKQRLAVVRKSAAAGQAAAVDTKSTSLLASAPASANASTPVKPAGAAAASPSPSPGMPRIPRV